MNSNISKMHSLLIIISLLAVNIVEQAASVVTGTIPGMAKSFPNESLVDIEMVTTVVSIFVTIFVLVSGAVVKIIGQKKTAVLGLLIATIASVVPGFSNSFIIILISRAVLGIGIGLANPLAISMIGLFFEGDQRARLMGWRSAIAGIGTAIMTYVAGKLLYINWQASYWVYLLFVPTLIMFLIFVPDVEQESNSHLQKAPQVYSESKEDSWLLITILALITFLVMTVVMVLAVKLPTYFIESKIGSATQASTSWSIVNFAGVLGGFLFGPCYKLMKKNVLPLGLLLGGIGIVLISVIESVTIIYIICVFIGISSSLIIPYIFNTISEKFSRIKAPFFTSIVLVGSNLGASFSPYSGRILGATAKIAIRNAGLIEVILAVIILVVYLKNKKQYK